MSFRKLCKFILIAGSVLALSSCKDDEETESLPSLNGNLQFQVAAFVEPGEILKMTPGGVKHPDGKTIGYYWRVTPGMSTADTTRYENGLDSEDRESDGTFYHQFSDSLITFTVSCTAFAKGYSSTYASNYVTVVKPGLDGSLTRTGIIKEDKKITVGGIDYYYVSHNGLDWMRNNLANPAYGAPYRNSDAISEILGRLYSYEDAVKACPEGWRLPSDKEWTELAAAVNGGSVTREYETIPNIAADFMADAQFNLKEMWEYWPEVGEITNKSQMGMIPVGYSNLGEKVDGKYPTAAFTGIYEYSTFWTSDKVADENDMAYYRYIISDQPEMYVSKGDISSFGASVRCVRRSEQ